MTVDGLPYEEYRGWYIARGITMPSQGIFEVNIYDSYEKCMVFEEPYAIVDTIDEAREWIDMKESGIRPTPREERGYGSYVVFTNHSTNETARYYCGFPPDSEQAESAALFMMGFMVRQWGENISYEIIPVE